MVAGSSIAAVFIPNGFLPHGCPPRGFCALWPLPKPGRFLGGAVLILVFRDEAKMRLLRLRRDWKNHSTGHAAYRTDLPRSHRHPDFPLALAHYRLSGGVRSS
jgi:hypothetical protein